MNVNLKRLLSLLLIMLLVAGLPISAMAASINDSTGETELPDPPKTKVVARQTEHYRFSIGHSHSCYWLRENMHDKNSLWITCPLCGGKTKAKVYQDTVLVKFPLFCPKCKRETIVDVVQLKMVISK